MTEDQAVQLLSQMQELTEIITEIQVIAANANEIIAFLAGLIVGILSLLIFFFFLKGAA
jgi:hypothetical protein